MGRGRGGAGSSRPASVHVDDFEGKGMPQLKASVAARTPTPPKQPPPPGPPPVPPRATPPSKLPAAMSVSPSPSSANTPKVIRQLWLLDPFLQNPSCCQLLHLNLAAF